MLKFEKATKRQARLRLALIGPSGSGKTYTALAVAQHLGDRIAVIDSERGSASKYADLFHFDVHELEQFDPRLYVEALHAAEAAGYDVIVVDSLSHAWMGRGGVLDLVDQFTKRSKSGNAFTEGWREASPLHNQMVDALVQCRAHLIATLRAKQDYVLDTDPKTGRTVPRKVGLAPVQREGVEYEFDVVGDLDLEHTFVITKTRCPALDGQVMPKPGRELAEILKAWLSDGVEPAQTNRPDLGKGAAGPKTRSAIEQVREELRTLEERNGAHPISMAKRPGWEGVIARRLEQLLGDPEHERLALALLFPESGGEVGHLTDSQLLAFHHWTGVLKDNGTGQWQWPDEEQERCRQTLQAVLRERSN